jgi:hypothetical protein
MHISKGYDAQYLSHVVRRSIVFQERDAATLGSSK